MPADSLQLLAVKNEYDLGGRLLLSTSYPFGLTQGGVNRAIKTQYSYDRLGRIDYIMALKGGVMPASIAHYEYYPTGAVRRVTLGEKAIAIDYTYHISGAVKTAVAKNLADNSTLYSETLYYEDCGTAGCTPQYNGNISRMAHEMAVDGGKKRTSDYAYDFMNRLTDVDDKEQDEFDEYFAYDAQGRITVQRRGANVNNKSGGEYVYYSGTNKLKSVASGMGGSADKRDMSASDNFEYDAEGNMTKDNSKDMSIAYDWRGMPVEFKRFRCTTTSYTVCDSVLLRLAYDGSGRRISKTRMMKTAADGDWYVDNVTHYTGIGTEVRESYFGGAMNNAKVVVNLPQGLGRYQPEDAVDGLNGVSGSQLAGYRPPAKFEWYLKNHIGSTMLVYGTFAYNDPFNSGYKGGVKAAYDYRATVVAMRTKQQVAKCCPPFGEQVSLAEPTDKVTENFTGKERDDETELNYFGARYLDPMIGLWISVDPARQFSSPYLYVGNGMNPVNGVDPDGNAAIIEKKGNNVNVTIPVIFSGNAATKQNIEDIKRMVAQQFNGEYGQYNVKTNVVDYNPEIHGHIKNNVSLFNGRSPICGQEGGGSCANIGSLPGIASINALDDHGILHEFGHLMGLDEKYWARYMESKLPYDGYEDNLMGDPSGFDITPGQIEEMWGPGSNRPSNGYESNVIIEYE